MKGERKMCARLSFFVETDGKGLDIRDDVAEHIAHTPAKQREDD